jgi:DNA repair protein RadC
MGNYKSIHKIGRDEIIINKSKFIGTACPVETEEEALAFIDKIKKEFKGISDVKASKLMALAEISKRMSSLKIEKIKISSPDDAAVIMMEEMRYYQKEYFKIILLDTKNNIKKISEISVGSLNSSIVHPREVFYEAVTNLASSIILVHNHPSGECEPSHEDIVLTNRLDECGKILGIKILDHIIIGDGVYFSFKSR